MTKSRNFLTEEELDSLREMLSTKEWGRLREQTTRGWGNKSMEYILRSNDKDIQSNAFRLKYGTEALLWFFDAFLVNLAQGASKNVLEKVDNEEDV